MIFLNISTDYVQLLSSQEEKLIFRNQVEKELGSILTQRFRKYRFSTVLLLNGPGGFTNLRVGALCLNLLQTLSKTLEDKDIELQGISKLDLFDFAVQKGLLPNLGAVYIGQKKTLWLYDFEKKSHTVVKKEELPYTQDNIFFDKVYDTEYFTEDIASRQISFSREEKNNIPVMHYQKQSLLLDINKIPVKKTDLVHPNYMVQPVLGVESKTMIVSQ